MNFEIIRSLGHCLRNRLSNEILDSSLAYIDYNEPVLAFETLCDTLADFGVTISKVEYDHIIQLAQMLGQDISEARYKFLQTLVTSHTKVIEKQ